jgi:hypothetical protein
MADDPKTEEAKKPTVTLEELQHVLRKFWGSVYGPAFATQMRATALAMTMDACGGQEAAMDAVSAFVATQMIATCIKILRNLKVPQDEIETLLGKLSEPPSVLVTGGH